MYKTQRKKTTQKIPWKFHFLMLLLLFSVRWLLVLLLLALYTQFDRHLLEGIEYFSEPIRTLHSTSVCICGIVYLRLQRLSPSIASFVWLYCGEMCKQTAHAHNLPNNFRRLKISLNAVYYIRHTFMLSSIWMLFEYGLCWYFGLAVIYFL